MLYINESTYVVKNKQISRCNSTYVRVIYRHICERCSRMIFDSHTLSAHGVE